MTRKLSIILFISYMEKAFLKIKSIFIRRRIFFQSYYFWFANWIVDGEKERFFIGCSYFIGPLMCGGANPFSNIYRPIQEKKREFLFLFTVNVLHSIPCTSVGFEKKKKKTRRETKLLMNLEKSQSESRRFIETHLHSWIFLSKRSLPQYKIKTFCKFIIHHCERVYRRKN